MKKKKNKMEILDSTDEQQETVCADTEIEENDTVKETSENSEQPPEKSELEQAQDQAREYLDSLQRLKAEFDNFRKRMAKEKQRLAELHQSIVIEAILPTLDSFDAALQNQTGKNDEVFKGMTLIYDGLMSSLKKLGLEKMDLDGKPFDPEQAEALMTQPSSDVDPDTVIGLITAGYTFKKSVLRPARVVVSAAPVDSTENSSSDGTDDLSEEDNN